MSLGIEKIKNAAKAVIRFGNKLEDVLADGKVTFIEGITLAIGTAPDAFEVAQDAKEIKAEFKDLDDVERKVLVDYVVEELDLESEKVEDIAEAGFEFLLALDNFRRAIRDAKGE